MLAEVSTIVRISIDDPVLGLTLLTNGAALEEDLQFLILAQDPGLLHRSGVRDEHFHRPRDSVYIRLGLPRRSQRGERPAHSCLIPVSPGNRDI